MERILLRGRRVTTKDTDGLVGKVPVRVWVRDECEIVVDPAMAEGAGADGGA